ncbi:hypothetical protein BC567DRAFT_211291 [Phyllosticta citribraziliensis]
MTSPPPSLDHSNKDTRSAIPESNASHDRSKSEPKSPRQTPGTGSGNNSSSASKRQRISPSPARSYKILKNVARRGYYEDVYGAYPSTDEDREGGSIPCESDSDGPPTLSARVSNKKQSKRAAIKSRRHEERAMADAFERRLKAGASESSAVLKMKLDDDEDAKAARDEFKKGKTFRQYMEELDQIDKSHPILPDSYRRMFSWWKGCDEPMAPEKIAWHRRHMRQLEGVSSSEDSSPLSSPRSTTPEPPFALPSSAPQPESSQNASKGTKGFVDPRTGEFMVPLSALKEMIPLSVLKEKFTELPGDFVSRNEALHSDIPRATKESNDTPKRANEALDRDIPCATTESNDPPKRANEGPMDALEPPSKKLRRDSGASGGESHGKDIGLTDDEEKETSPESRDSSVPNWVRRSRRPASNSTPLYRADQHPADKFLDSTPKTRDETSFIHVVDSDDEDQDSDQSVVRRPRTKSLSRPTEPPRPTTPRKQKTALAVSRGSSGTPKKRGRKPGTRVVNGKVVLPSEVGSPPVPLPSEAKSPSVPRKGSGILSRLPTKTSSLPSENPKFNFDEPTITKKRTPIPSEKVRANSMYDAATKKAPAQPKSSKIDTDASKSKTQTSAASPRSTTTPSKSTQADKSPAKRKPPTLSTAASVLTRRENGFIRGNSDFEEAEEESTESTTTHNGDDAGKTKISFRVPPRRPTPPIPKSSGALNRRLFH